MNFSYIVILLSIEAHIFCFRNIFTVGLQSITTLPYWRILHERCKRGPGPETGTVDAGQGAVGARPSGRGRRAGSGPEETEGSGSGRIELHYLSKDPTRRTPARSNHGTDRGYYFRSSSSYSLAVPVSRISAIRARALALMPGSDSAACSPACRRSRSPPASRATVRAARPYVDALP